MLLNSGVALGLTQGAFELDKNATNDLATAHRGTLKSSATSTAGSLTVCERTGATIPTVPFTIQVDGEQMTVTLLGNASNKTGGCSFLDPADTTAQVRPWTVTRHINGTTAASHSGGADVTGRST